MSQSITIAELPKNFQHAIRVTRAIGVPYLWIDALCIIQDSKEDWGRESILMGLLYASAICMISATASPNSDGGLFFPRRKLEEVTECNLGIQGKKSLIVRPEDFETKKIAAMDSVFDRYVERAPLTQRGWTFQERVLAPRILHFCDGFVLFECNTLRASEIYFHGVDHVVRRELRVDGTLRPPDEEDKLLNPVLEDEYIYPESASEVFEKTYERVPIAGGVMLMPRTGPVFPRNPNYKTAEQLRREYLRSAALAGMRGEFQLLLKAWGSEANQMIEFNKSWYEIVGRYAGRNLTKHSDKIPALLGVADFIKKSTGRKFVAGLWEDCLRLNMIWNVKGIKSTAKLQIAAPTWSWVSINGSVETQLRLLLPGSRNTSISYLTSDIRLKDIDRHDGWVTNGRLFMRGRICDFAQFHTHIIMDSADTGQSGTPEKNYLPILAVSEGPSGDDNTCQIYGIIIRRNSAILDEFVRTGYFSMPCPTSSLGDFDALNLQPKRRISLL
ncbi:hypothetical protein G7Z17_g1699 [Cylindrodendrum hubeiense]|uniref:Heterokaryon incompatibility domain-containing protein n=1 Tax=Cylindrodendrum hubeiense TaxID=595255 RepID=A0A9P5HL37_9HYPO|nr:hypothetical protein G7Z17_g1699 [Cylindrodendrum hubeiense]